MSDANEGNFCSVHLDSPLAPSTGSPEYYVPTDANTFHESLMSISACARMNQGDQVEEVEDNLAPVMKKHPQLHYASTTARSINSDNFIELSLSLLHRGGNF